MSTLSQKSQRWRRLGSLKFLASELAVSVKQAARYWDKGWVPNCIRTPGGARRVRYNDQTVEQVRRTVESAKQTNRAIRYWIGNEITYCGTAIDVRGCKSMDDLFERARAAGLSKTHASNFAYRPRLQKTTSPDKLAWDSLWARESVTAQEAADSTRLFDLLPLAALLAATRQEEFQKIAEATWLRIEPYLEGESQDKVQLLRHLLNQPNRECFVREWNKATELDNRIMNRTDEELRKAMQWASEDPNRVRLHLAALQLHRSQQRPTGSTLARAFGLSRTALYRLFGKTAIQATLRGIRHDPLAAEATSNAQWAEGKTTAQGTRTALRRDR